MGQVICSSRVCGNRRVGSLVSLQGESNLDMSKCVCMHACILYGRVGTVIPWPRLDRDPEPKRREQ